MESRPYIRALTGIKPWYPKRYAALRSRYESNNYYKVRAMIMEECYLKGWNAKEICGYFKIGVKSFYKFCDLRKLKEQTNGQRLEHLQIS